MNRYARQTILPELGEEGQKHLLQSSVLVIGAGGLGCPVLQYLAAAGVGRIGIIDADKVDLSNLQRQVLYRHDDIGKSKAVVASERIKEMNPDIMTDVYEAMLTLDNAVEIIEEYDLIIDGSDNFPTRYLVNDACVMLNKPWVFGSILRFEGQVSVFNYNDGPTYRCLFPEPPSAEYMLNCAEAGVIGVLPGIIGSLQANEAIKVLTGMGVPLSGKLLIFDALTTTSHTLKITADPEMKKIDQLGDYHFNCAVNTEITYDTLEAWKREGLDYIVLDIRDEDEYKKNPSEGILIAPQQLESYVRNIPEDQEVILLCQHGVRSKKATEMLRDKNFQNVFSLAGGLDSIQQRVYLQTEQ